MTKYKVCPECKKEAVHLATAHIDEWYGDQDDREGGPSKYNDENPPTDHDEVSLFAHICFECGHLVDVGIERPRSKAINTGPKKESNE